jgi:dipeptidyl aminopeptidase/acylaminoacyl peptidase
MMKVRSVNWKADDITIVGELRLPEGSAVSPALCICHGIPSGKPADPGDRGYPGLAERFCLDGLVTLIFNFRGTGPSGGNFDMLGWTRDLEGAVDYLHSCPQVDRSRVYLMGFSGGAAASTYVAAHDGRVARLVLCACPAEFRRIVVEKRADFSIEHFRQIGLIRDSHFPPSLDDWADSFRELTPVNWIDKIAPRPLLMIQGKDDDLIDEAQAWRLYEKAGEPKEMVIVAGAGHKLRLSDQAMDIALAWLRKPSLLSS